MTERIDLRLPKQGAKLLPGGNRVDTVGESFYAQALIDVVGLAGGDFGATMIWASLVPDPANPYDSNAVKVVIADKQVGHLDRSTAIVFGPVARRIVELGCEVQCAAMIVGRKGMFGVVLDLGAPDDCLKELG
ncbi:MAG: HIRAN domain-containing protein [Chloroflexota bacterium]|nr:HIRAN domain-containing protein [Chloroflexota bacterium]